MSGMMKPLHAARRIDAKLVDRVEGVAFRVGEIDQADGRVFLPRHLVAIHLRLEQQRLHRFVGVEQALARLAENLVDQAASCRSVSQSCIQSGSARGRCRGTLAAG